MEIQTSHETEASDLRARLAKSIEAVKEIRNYAARIPHGPPGRDLIIARVNLLLEELGVERLTHEQIRGIS
jgi:hypothetical protein